ncbi:glutamate receptor ionotropic, delta-2-like [Amblyomma americanum]
MGWQGARGYGRSVSVLVLRNVTQQRVLKRAFPRRFLPQYKPHLEVLKGETGDRLVGLLGDVLEALSLSLSFNYSLQLAADRSLGNVLPNGTATGLVGRLQRDEADLAMAMMVPSNERNRAARHTAPVYSDEITILAAVPAVDSGGDSSFGFLRAFDMSVWLCLLASLLVCCVFSASADSRPGAGGFLRRGVHHFFGLLGNLLQQGGSAGEDVRGQRYLAARALRVVWWLSALVLAYAMAGQMKACLSVRSEGTRIDSLEDLALKPDVRPLLFANSILVAMLSGSERPVWRHVWRMVERHAGQVPIDELYGPAHLAEVARGSSVILSDRTSFRYVVGRSCSRFPHAQFYVAREPINTLSFGLYVNARLDTRFRRALDQRLGWLRESGLMDLWTERMLPDWGRCAQRQRGFQSLSLKDLRATLVVAALMGSTLPLLALLAELRLGRPLPRPRRR